MKLRSSRIWLLWLISTLMMTTYFLFRLLSDDKSIFLPGRTSHGHYQIESACDACHTIAFGGRESLQMACLKCHEQELKASDDTHPRSKFTDPRNAELIGRIDALYCVTCHTEHKPEITGYAGVTAPGDFCINCHESIAEDRPSHQVFEFTDCASAGCHNYHDNRALYEDFLLKHLDEENLLKSRTVPRRNLKQSLVRTADYPRDKYPFRRLQKPDYDTFENTEKGNVIRERIIEEWRQSSHAANGVNCSACHGSRTDSPEPVFVDKPGQKVCSNCHKEENRGFLGSMHGMRRAQGLSPVTPSMSGYTMLDRSRHKQSDCISCHGAHRFDTGYAAVNACLNCHADRHSKAYKQSPHYRYWLQERRGDTARGQGVSCATCHFPRYIQKQGGSSLVRVQHNQNDNLRPNEKMLRGVCMQCHGMGFAINALADRKLIDNNFNTAPKQHVNSLDMVRKYIEKE